MTKTAHQLHVCKVLWIKILPYLVRHGLILGIICCSFFSNAQSPPIDSIWERLQLLDTTLTANELVPLMEYVQKNAKVNPNKLDKLARKLYRQNEKEKHKAAIKTAGKLLALSPNNVTGLKEMAYALHKLGDENSAAAYFRLMTTSINAVLLTGEGSYSSPVLVNNSFELYSIIEASYRLSANQSGVLKSTRGEIRAFYKAGSISLFGYIQHWEPFLKRGQFTRGDIDINEINRTIELDSIPH